MSAKKENNLWKMLAPIVVLVAICLVVTAALAGTNAVTKPMIEAAEQKKADAALAVVLPEGESFETMALDGLPEGVTAASKAGNGAGYVFTVTTKGFDAGLVVMVGLDDTGAISGVKVLSHKETAGIGTNVVDDGTPFLTQLPGMTDVSGIEATSGATMSSNGVTNAIQTAFDAYTIASGGTVEAKVAPKPESLTDEVLAQYFPGASFTEVSGGMVSDAGTVVYGASAGMMGDVPVAVLFGSDDAVLGIVVDVMNETPGIGDLCGEPEFTDRFIGVTSGSEVDAISGSTITSEAIKAGVDAAIANLATVKGAA